MTTPQTKIEALDVFEDAQARHARSHGEVYRRCCNRAGLAAAEAHIAALPTDGITEVELRDGFTGPILIVYGRNRDTLRELGRRLSIGMLDETGATE